MGFRERVYEVVARIPSGRVMGYAHVGGVLGSPRLARQVGYALAALPADRDVPWHRVIRSSGHIAFEGDPIRGSLQRGLLAAEGVLFTGERTDMARFGWSPPEPG